MLVTHSTIKRVAHLEPRKGSQVSNIDEVKETHPLYMGISKYHVSHHLSGDTIHVVNSNL